MLKRLMLNTWFYHHWFHCNTLLLVIFHAVAIWIYYFSVEYGSITLSSFFFNKPNAPTQCMASAHTSSSINSSMAWGRFTNVSRALQKNLAKMYNARNHIYSENFKLNILESSQNVSETPPGLYHHYASNVTIKPIGYFSRLLDCGK